MLSAPPFAAPLRREAIGRYGAAPRALAPAFSAFLAAAQNPRWTALWDPDTGRPARIWGGYFEAEGTSGSAGTAEKHARAFLSEHRDLLLAGRPVEDFDLTASHEESGFRTIGYQQYTMAGSTRVKVVGGRVSLRYKADRLFMLASEALPVSPFAAPEQTQAQAASSALAYLSVPTPGAFVVSTELVAIPLVYTGRFDVKLAYRVTTESASPPSRAEVMVDARDGSILAARETIRFLSGSLKYEAPVRGPSEHQLYLASRADLTIDGAKVQAGPDGSFSFDPGASNGACFARGDLVQVVNVPGPDNVSLSFAPTDSQEVIWSLKDDERGDAQLSAFIHTSIAKEHARQIDPAMAYLDKKLTVRVNQEDGSYACNAYWNGVTLNFFVEYDQCENTARMADVVYHEFGHAFHTASILDGAGAADPALGEGGADYFAASVTGDPVVGPGFFKSNGGYIREMDSDLVWPKDIDWDPHVTGLIFAGAMWDLRGFLMTDLGEEAGKALADQLYQAALRSSTTLPSTFPEILAADDDDGDLSNGTPHICSILRAFVPHGLTPYLDPSGVEMIHTSPRLLPQQTEPYELSAETKQLFPQCATGESIEGVTLKWRTMVNGGTIPMTLVDGKWTGKIPGQIAGTQIRYALTAKNGPLQSVLPDNPADQEYKLFVGTTTPLYCADFEAQESGWTFGESSGKTADFGWMKPAGQGGDPSGAYSGEGVIGNGLSAGGKYLPDRSSFAESPVIDVGGHNRLRLQLMRWLSVEDGAYDQARILVNDQPIWQNVASDSQEYPLYHEDREWRFEDLDIGSFAAGESPSVKIRFELASDGEVEFGGWNIDDVCVVAWDFDSTGGQGGGGGDGGGGQGGGGTDPPEEGCSCRTAGSPASAPVPGTALTGAMLAWLFSRRRSRQKGKS